MKQRPGFVLAFSLALALSSASAAPHASRTLVGFLSVPGIGGLAFDGFGYQNYRRCYCEDCETRFQAFLAAHPELPKTEGEIRFFRDQWVDVINGLAAYARGVQPGIPTTIHIWPVFAPDPLYGNRLDVDYCGQTAAWYTLWPAEKIAEYSRIITENARTYHTRQTGVPMIGYYDKPGQFPVKDASRLEMEIQTILDNGGRRIQVCATGDVIDNEDVAAVFKRFFAPDEPAHLTSGASRFPFRPRRILPTLEADVAGEARMGRRR